MDASPITTGISKHELKLFKSDVINLSKIIDGYQLNSESLEKSIKRAQTQAASIVIPLQDFFDSYKKISTQVGQDSGAKAIAVVNEYRKLKSIGLNPQLFKNMISNLDTTVRYNSC